MYALAVTFHLKPGMGETFLPLIVENARASVAGEPGCRQFDVCVNPGDADTVFLYEIYDDQAAFEAHTRTAHFDAFNDRADDMIADKVVHTFTKVIR